MITLQKLFRSLLLLTFVALGLTACNAKEQVTEDPNNPKMFGSSITIYNYTNEGISNLRLNGNWGGSQGTYNGGGSFVCCGELPEKWNPNYRAEVEWTAGDYTLPLSEILKMPSEEVLKCCWRERELKKQVPVEKYDKPYGRIQVFILPNDEVKIYVSDKSVTHPEHPSGLRDPEDLSEKDTNIYKSGVKQEQPK